MGLTNKLIERGLVKLYPFGYTHRVISYKVHRLLVTLSYFRPDRFVQLLSLIPILILLIYLLVSIDLVYTNLILTLMSPSLKRSSVHRFARVSSRMRTTVVDAGGDQGGGPC